MQEKKSIVLVDTYNLIYRAYHATKIQMSQSGNEATAAVYTTLRMLKSLRANYPLSQGVTVFDGGGASFRDSLVDDYKANRSSTPDELKSQIPLVITGAGLFGWNNIIAKNAEADDVLGSLAIEKEKQGFMVYIISGDKDFRQLVSPNIHVIDTMYKIVYDEQKVFDVMGIKPTQVRDYLALLGDSSDNVKGVNKVGKTTAAKLLNTYGSIDSIIENLHNLKGVVAQNIKTAHEDGSLELARKLVSLDTNYDLSECAQNLDFKAIDYNALDAFFLRHNMPSLMQKNKVLKKI